jgi:Bifunctional DNA primase/polymerase, N-terminal/Primase C terminal 1 (PriCT-1)
VMVLDVDGDEGEATLATHERKLGALPATIESITGGGGRHVYFRAPKVAVRNSVGKLGAGLDIRAAGGYTILPPSLHATGKEYCWSVDSAGRFAECPEWLLDLATAGAAPRDDVGDMPAEGGTDWAEFIRTGVDKGRRNDSMTRLVGMLMTRFDPLTAEQLALAVNATSFRPPLSPSEVENICNSIASIEARKRTAL